MYTDYIRPADYFMNGTKTKSHDRERDIPGNGKEFLTLFQAFVTPVKNFECSPAPSLRADYCLENNEMETAAEQGENFCPDNLDINKGTVDSDETPGEKIPAFASRIVPGGNGLLSFIYPGEIDPSSLGKVNYKGIAMTREPVFGGEIQANPQTMEIAVQKIADSLPPVLSGSSEFKEVCSGMSLSTDSPDLGEKVTWAQGDDGINPLPDIKEPGFVVRHRLFPEFKGEPMIIKESGSLKNLTVVEQQTINPNFDEEVQPEFNLVKGEVPGEQSGNRITMDRLPAKIRTVLNNNHDTNRPRTLELQLEPETLGTVKVTVNWTKGQISAKFLAQTDSAAAALNCGLETLKEGLSRLQINIVGLSVAIAGQSGKETGGSQVPHPKRARNRVERGRSPDYSSISFHSGTSSVNCLI